MIDAPPPSAAAPRSAEPAPRPAPATEGVRDDARLREMAARDAALRARRTAQLAAGAPHAGPVSYAYARGPDGRRYAVEAHLAVDLAPAPAGPEATAAKMRAVAAAAAAVPPLAPAEQRLLARAEALLAEALAALRAEAETRAARRL